MSFLALALIEATPWWAKTYPEYLNLNPSHVLFMMVPFWVTVIGAWTLAVKPLLKIIEEREHLTVGAREETAELETKFTERLAAYEKRLAETKVKAAEERAAIRKTAAEEEAKILGAAHEAASAEIEKMRVAAEAERTRVRAELGKQAETLAREIAEKALGRDLGGATPTGRSQPGARP